VAIYNMAAHGRVLLSRAELPDTTSLTDKLFGIGQVKLTTAKTKTLPGHTLTHGVAQGVSTLVALAKAVLHRQRAARAAHAAQAMRHGAELTGIRAFCSRP